MTRPLPALPGARTPAGSLGEQSGSREDGDEGGRRDPATEPSDNVRLRIHVPDLLWESSKSDSILCAPLPRGIRDRRILR